MVSCHQNTAEAAHWLSTDNFHTRLNWNCHGICHEPLNHQHTIVLISSSPRTQEITTAVIWRLPGRAGISCQANARLVVYSRQMRGQYSGHVIALDQWEANVVSRSAPAVASMWAPIASQGYLTPANQRPRTNHLTFIQSLRTAATPGEMRCTLLRDH